MRSKEPHLAREPQVPDVYKCYCYVLTLHAASATVLLVVDDKTEVKLELS